MEDRKLKYIKYIKEKYPDIEIQQINSNLTDGLHNDVIIINDRDVFRFAKHDFSKKSLT
ncbi:hypothetical protein [Paenibacillus apii]|uniref:hypothetical protein n=1 Tax=Paenibacillus apii TaxID=1850370 RepID=UPI00197FA242|nr:hypothetical protein [Paenibacillus apii]